MMIFTESNNTVFFIGLFTMYKHVTNFHHKPRAPQCFLSLQFDSAH